MRRLRAAILVAFLGWLSALALDLFGIGERLELLTLDARYATGIGRAAPSDEVMIAWIDQESLEFAAREGMGFPWPRTLYEEVLGYLRECGAKVVAFDLLFDQISSPETDRAFGAALATRPDTVLVAKLVSFRQGAATAVETARYRERGVQPIAFPRDLTTAPGVVLPLPELEQGAAKIGFSNVAADTDRTHRHYDLVRGFQPASESETTLVPSFALASVMAARPDFDLPHALRHGARRLIGFRGGEFTFAKVKVVNIVQSMMAVADGRTPLYGKEQFENRIVLVGIHADGLEDAHPTPLSRAFPGVELHATAIDNLLRDDFLREVGFAPVFAATAAVLAALAVFAFAGVLAPVLALLVLVAALVGAALLAWQAHVAVPLALPLAAGGATTAFGFGWRLWSEGRQKREMRRAFASYVAPEVLAEVLANPETLALGGSSREVTLFFTDLAGFTGLAEHSTPRDLVAFLNDYFTRMCEPVLAEHGVIDKFLGDSIMAIFGAPLPSYDHPLRAVRAALAARQISEAIHSELIAAGRPGIETRIGIHTGTAVVGNMGSSKRFDYTAIGDVVNLASRLEGANKAFGTTILVSDDVWRHCRDRVLGRRVGRVAVKGRAEPIVVHEPIAWLEDASLTQRQLVAAYEAALAAHDRGDSDGARTRIATLLQEHPTDALALLWRERLDRADWDGVFRLDAK